MHSAPDGMSPDFHHWRNLTDAYARQLDALERREPGASAGLRLIGIELAALNALFELESEPR